MVQASRARHITPHAFGHSFVTHLPHEVRTAPAPPRSRTKPQRLTASSHAFDPIDYDGLYVEAPSRKPWRWEVQDEYSESIFLVVRTKKSNYQMLTPSTTSDTSPFSTPSL